MRNIFLDKIYVSVASYMDLDLGFTIYDMLSKARYPKRLFISIFDQDDKHVDLTSIFDKFGFSSYVHNKIDFSDSVGVGFARLQTQKNLTVEHKFYLQVDSHTRFVDDWDVKLIDDYVFCNVFWDDYIFSTYPQPFEFVDDGVRFVDEVFSNNLKIVDSDSEFLPFESKYDGYVLDVSGVETGYFCGGFAFGYSRLFPKNFSEIYFNGEEQAMSIRLFANDVKVVAPYNNYVFHDYDGFLRNRNWERTADWQLYSDKSSIFLSNFFVSEKTVVDNFLEKFRVSNTILS